MESTLEASPHPTTPAKDTPYEFLCAADSSYSAFLVKKEWDGIDWATIAELSPSDIRPAVQEKMGVSCYKVMAVLREALGHRQMQEGRHYTGHSFLLSDAGLQRPPGRSLSMFSNDGTGRHVLSQTSLSTTSTLSTSSGTLSDGAYTTALLPVLAGSSIITVAGDDNGSGHPPPQVHYDEDREGYPIFDPTNADHVRYFRAQDFNPEQDLPSPTGVDPKKAGLAKNGSRQQKYSVVANTFEPANIWGLESKGEGSGSHRNTAHYDRYICNTWMAGGGQLEYTVRRYKDRSVLHLSRPNAYAT